MTGGWSLARVGHLKNASLRLTEGQKFMQINTFFLGTECQYQSYRRLATAVASKQVME